MKTGHLVKRLEEGHTETHRNGMVVL